MDSPGKNTGTGCHALLQGDLPNPETEPISPTMQVDSLPTELPGKPKNTGVNSLSLLQGIFPTQELNQGLLHCRWILYPLSYKGRPRITNLIIIALLFFVVCFYVLCLQIWREYPCPVNFFFYFFFFLSLNFSNFNKV